MHGALVAMVSVMIGDGGDDDALVVDHCVDAGVEG